MDSSDDLTGDYKVIISRREEIRGAFQFWKEIESTLPVRQERSSSTTEILGSHKVGNLDDLDQKEIFARRVLRPKSMSLSLIRYQERDNESGKRLVGKEESNEEIELGLNEKSVKRVRKRNTEKSLKPGKGERFSPRKPKSRRQLKESIKLDVNKESVDVETSSQKVVESKRLMFARQKQYAVSPLSAENPILAVRENILGMSNTERKSRSGSESREEDTSSESISDNQRMLKKINIIPKPRRMSKENSDLHLKGCASSPESEPSTVNGSRKKRRKGKRRKSKTRIQRETLSPRSSRSSLSVDEDFPFYTDDSSLESLSPKRHVISPRYDSQTSLGEEFRIKTMMEEDWSPKQRSRSVKSDKLVTRRRATENFEKGDSASSNSEIISIVIEGSPKAKKNKKIDKKVSKYKVKESSVSESTSTDMSQSEEDMHAHKAESSRNLGVKEPAPENMLTLPPDTSPPELNLDDILTKEVKNRKTIVANILETFFKSRTQKTVVEIFGVSLDIYPPIGGSRSEFVAVACDLLKKRITEKNWDSTFNLASKWTAHDRNTLKSIIEDHYNELNVDMIEDLNAVAKSLVLFFTELQEPLCTSRKLDDFLYLSRVADKVYAARLLYSLMYSIPAQYRNAIVFVAKFIKQLANDDEEKILHLCQYFGSSIFRPKVLDPNEIYDTYFKIAYETEVLHTTIMFTKYDQFFWDDPNCDVEKLSEKKTSMNIKFDKPMNEKTEAVLTLKLIVDNIGLLTKKVFQDRVFIYSRGTLRLDLASELALIQMLTDEFFDDPDYMDLFFYNYSSFVSEKILFMILMDMYVQTEYTLEFSQRRRERILMALKKWFINECKLLSHVPNFVNLVSKTYKEHKHTKKEEKQWIELLKILRDQLKTFNELPKLQHHLHVAAFSFKADPLDYHPAEVSRAITLLDMDLVKQIDPKECLNDGGYFTSMADQFNRISLWVQYKIASVSKVKERADRIAFFCQVLSELMSHQNFNGALAVFTALSSHNLTKLTKTWEKVSKKTKRPMEMAEALFSFCRNYKNYQEKLKEAPLPAIPVFALLSMGLVAVRETVDMKTNELLNIQRLQSLYTFASTIKKYQKSEYSFNRNNHLIKHLQTTELATEDEICALCDDEKKRRLS